MKKKSSFKNKKLSLGNRLATITLLIGIYLLVSCQNEKPEPPKLPTLTTTAISNITSSSASGGGNISNDGGAAITARGIVWSTNPTPTIALTTKTADGTGVGSFTSNLLGFTPATKYYVRAYASSSVGTTYGEEVTFTTSAAAPTLSTTAISNITSSSASGGGNISNDGGAAITARGIVWSINPAPTIALTTKTADGTGVGSFTSNLLGFTPATKYYVRAYASNSVGTTYGEEVMFTTLANLPTLTAIAISNITSISANSGGNISNDGGAAITARGIVWSTNPTPTIALTTKTADGTGVGSFTSNLIGLLPATIYYVRAYASNSAGTAYSGEFSFTSVSDITITTTPSFLGLNSFYQKYLNAFGLPVVSSNKVPDAAVLQAKRIVDQMLAKIPNSALEKMVQNKMLVAIMAKDEVTTDIPEHSDLNRVFPATDWNKRARGLGATIQRPATSCAEENLLCYPTDGYSGEDILIHEFAHTIHLIGLNLAFPTFDNELKNIYNEAIAKGLWTNTYAASNYVEYFAEGVQDWFNVNKEAIPTNGIHNNINTREELKTYDPKLYELISRYFNEDSKKVSCQIGK